VLGVGHFYTIPPMGIFSMRHRWIVFAGPVAIFPAVA
jgi:uncharacterized membrane protein YdfJ with MMPL/SSD domain